MNWRFWFLFRSAESGIGVTDAWTICTLLVDIIQTYLKLYFLSPSVEEELVEITNLETINHTSALSIA